MTRPSTEERRMIDTAELERFADWFRQNYPGPDTIIGRPDWHAPKIYRAATHELRKELDEARAALTGEAKP